MQTTIYRVKVDGKKYRDCNSTDEALAVAYAYAGDFQTITIEIGYAENMR